MITIQNAPTREPLMKAHQNSPIWILWFGKLVTALNSLTASGTTAQRPNPAPFIGFMYFDTTVNRPIWAKTTTQYVYSDGSAA